MQETIPQLEIELEAIVARFVANAVRDRSPAMGEVARHRLFEGYNSAIVRPDGEEDETETRRISAESEIPSKSLLYTSLDEFLHCFIPAAEDIAYDQEKMFIEVMRKVTEKTGNVVDGRGQPFSYETILKGLETIQIDFDSDGKPRMPTMMVSPTMNPRINELIEDPAEGKFEKRLQEIIEMKRLEWREREANRTLVG